MDGPLLLRAYRVFLNPKLPGRKKNFINQYLLAIWLDAEHGISTYFFQGYLYHNVR